MQEEFVLQNHLKFLEQNHLDSYERAMVIYDIELLA